jgi:putative tryptophan/tyrosine transport system permease protein
VLTPVLSILDNALLQGLGYGVAALGVALAFRVLRYPDLTADGSFLLGGVVVASIVSAGGH